MHRLRQIAFSKRVHFLYRPKTFERRVNIHFDTRLRNAKVPLCTDLLQRLAHPTIHDQYRAIEAQNGRYVNLPLRLPPMINLTHNTGHQCQNRP